MRTLVTCELPDAALDQLRALSGTFQYAPLMTPDLLREQIADVGILVVGGLRVSAEAIQRGKNLQMIVRAGTGPGDVALEEASAQGVFVSHCPDKHATAVAELAFALMLALDRRLLDYTTAPALTGGRPGRPDSIFGQGLSGRTLGIIGFGPAGVRIAQRARAFEMDVLAWAADPRGGPSVAGVELVNSRRELARRSHVVVLDSPEVSEGHQLIDAEVFQNMTPGTLFVHVGHPASVNEAVLVEAVQSGRIRAAVDALGPATSGERGTGPRRTTGGAPPRLLDLPGVIATPQIGTLTQQARTAVGDEVVRVVQNYLISGEPINCLNVCEHSPATWQLVLRVRDQVGVFATILDAIRADGINAEEISSRVFVGAKAAWLTISLDERPSADALDAIRRVDGVLHAELRAVV